MGLLLTSFGCFWSVEGAGVDWPGGDLALLGVIAFFAARLVVLVQCSGAGGSTLVPVRGRGMRYLRAFVRFWWDFIVGDDWRVAAGIAVALGLTVLLVVRGVNAWWLIPAAVASCSPARSVAPSETDEGFHRSPER